MVEFECKDGRKLEMELRYAELLKLLGHGTYMTRDMKAAQQAPALPAKKLEPAVEHERVAEMNQKPLKKMTLGELRALAHARQIAVDARWGRPRLIKAINERG